MTLTSQTIENMTDQYERQFEFDSLARLKKLAKEHRLVAKGRSKKAYIEVLVAEYRQNLENRASRN